MKHIVTVGGGTGSYTVLSGLKHLEDVSLTALVSMADDGGSTGVLRDELGVLPPGDVRQCLVALSEHSDIVRKLMNYRFSAGALSGHNFGNIFLAALEKVTGNFAEGVEVASKILKVKGKVIPITNDKAELSILLSGGKIFEGENKIDQANLQDGDIEKIFYKNNVDLNKRAKSAILKADFIIIGPGNFFCSLIPNLIVKDFKEIIHESKAKIILPINLTNKQGHTMHWKASDYLREIERYLEKPVDIILVNNEAPSAEQIEHYKLKEGDGVLINDDLHDTRVVREPLLSHLFVAQDEGDNLKDMRSFIRHDSSKLENSLAKIIK